MGSGSATIHVNTYKKTFFRWRYLFYSLISVWFCSLVVFFVNPKGTQQWLTKTVEGDVHSLSLLEARPNICEMHITHGWRMNDHVRDYWLESHNDGLSREPVRKYDVMRFVEKGDLVPITTNKNYYVDTMYYSFPYAQQHVSNFIDELCIRFQERLKQTDLYGTQLVVTSLLRTKSSVARLVKRNKNAIKHSSHLHGTTFDISYQTFLFERPLSEGEVAHLKETLAATLFDMREEGKCFVTYEYFQTCFHVVCRKTKERSENHGSKHSRKLETGTSKRV